jgi:hypothetical protein
VENGRGVTQQAFIEGWTINDEVRPIGVRPVLYVGELDEDPVLAERASVGSVTPSASTRPRSISIATVDRLGIGLYLAGVPGLQHELRAAAQVETEPRLLVQTERDAGAEQAEDEEKPDEGRHETEAQ